MTFSFVSPSGTADVSQKAVNKKGREGNKGQHLFFVLPFSMDRLINIFVMVTLIEMMVAIGLGVTFVELLNVARNWRLVTRAALANYVCVPAITVGLLLLFHPHPLVAAGFLILATCPGAPYGPPFTAIARGNSADAVGLMVLLAGSSAVVAPLLIRWLLPVVSADGSLVIDGSRIVTTLLVTQFLPLCVGIAVRQIRPTLAKRLQIPANLLSKILNLAVVGLILVVQFPLLAEIRLRALSGMLVLLVGSLAVSWLLGGKDTRGRKTMMVTTSLRNISVGLVVATSSFAGTPAVTAVVAYGLISLFGTLASAVFMGRMTRPD